MGTIQVDTDYTKKYVKLLVEALFNWLQKLGDSFGIPKCKIIKAKVIFIHCC